MDGNGRWAQKKDLKRIEGHKEGVKVVKEIVKHSVKLGIEYLTLYTLSKENFQRPVSEVLFLIRLFTKTLDDELNLLLDNNVKFNVIGDLTKIDKIALSKLKRVEKLTKNNSALSFISLLLICEITPIAVSQSPSRNFNTFRSA